ncbi:DapH/DapD/GlmU-related protein [Actinomycetaceae bacterium MB13-C1-2]|nr:DapH/DapD/GlmU-related protein [Actinomycetaceae bacterium MB13-C1-2]
MDDMTAWGIGLATVTESGRTLDVWYPQPHLGDKPKEGDPAMLERLSALERRDDARAVHTSVVQCVSDLRDQPASTADAYLRLHLLSHRLVRPGTVNLDGIRSRLPIVAWTSAGPCAVEDFEDTRYRLRAAYGHPVTLTGVDKFPAMVNYVVPTDVRIASAARVRLGAYLAPGTIVMHAGFVNYNAGAVGAATIEGRLAQGVTVGANSHVGGGASTMGRVAGAADQKVRIGERCVLGSNSGLGIPLGDDCVVEAGLFITANTKVSLMPGGGVVPGNRGSFIDPWMIDASRLSGASNVLFRRNSITGHVEALGRGGKSILLPSGTTL